MENLVLTQQTLPAIKQSLIDGLTIASGSKSSATYYHSRDEQMKAIQGQVEKLYKLSKELPLIIASQKVLLVNSFQKCYLMNLGRL